MEISSHDKAAVLVEALPYIQNFYGKTVVVKYGGNAMINEELKSKVIQDIVLMKFVGMRVVVVHGGGPDITDFLQRIGKQSRFVSGLRVTDAETVQIAEMVLVGKINTQIVGMLNNAGCQAVGLSGKDANLVQAKKKMAIVRDVDGTSTVDIGFVGEVVKINSRLLNDLLDRDYIPVIAPIGGGEDNESFNINADYVAAEVAGALKAEKLLLLTDIEGIYSDYNDKSTFISTLTHEEATSMMESGAIGGGMIPKVEACLRALDAGAAKTHIIDGRQPHSLLLEVFTPQGVGTEVV